MRAAPAPAESRHSGAGARRDTGAGSQSVSQRSEAPGTGHSGSEPPCGATPSQRNGVTGARNYVRVGSQSPSTCASE
jgi:hypothetical protein